MIFLRKLIIYLLLLLVPRLTGYMQTTEQTSAITEARDIYDAVNTVCEEFELWDLDIPEGSFTNGELPEDFYDAVNNFHIIDESYDYEIILENGSCTYVTVDIDDTVGSYPIS